MSVNFEKAQQLLSVIKDAVEHPNLQWLRDAAIKELHKLKPEEPKQEVPATPAPPDRPKEVNDILGRKV